MSLFHNEFDARPEIIFITYEDVIKSPYPYLLNKINTDLSDYYKDFIDLDKIKGLDMFNLTRLCVQRTEKNILRYLAKTEFDYDGALGDLKNHYFTIYKDSPLLSIGESLNMVIPQKFTKNVYIYTEKYDVRIHLDIMENFKDMDKVKYVSGSFAKALEKLEGITTFILNDLDYVIDILNAGKEEYTNIMIASYGYNYIYNEDDDVLELRLDLDQLLKGKICKYATFMPVNLDRKHFSQI
jgi:hypothetical protein